VSAPRTLPPVRACRSPRRSAAGFSLLETIVTMVVVAMIITVLMQALSQSLDLRSRLLRHERAARVSNLQEQWFRESVAGAMADLPDAFGEMTGDARSMRFVSASPLGSAALAQVSWSLQPTQGGWALHYADADWSDLVIIAGPLQQASFAYLDAGGEWQEQWDPAEDAEQVLPRMVRLQATTATGDLLWLVPVFADPRPPSLLRPQDLGNGL
jgi:general secretion pathway protein J